MPVAGQVRCLQDQVCRTWGRWSWTRGVLAAVSLSKGKNTTKYLLASCLPVPPDRYSRAHGGKEVRFLSCAQEQTALATRAPLANNIQGAPGCKPDQSGTGLRITSCLRKVSDPPRTRSRGHFLIREQRARNAAAGQQRLSDSPGIS